MNAPASSAHRGKPQVIAPDVLHRVAASPYAADQGFVTESELSEHDAVSRLTLGERPRILDCQDMRVQKPEPGDGVMVRKRTDDTFARDLSILLRLHGVPRADVPHLRTTIAPVLAAQVARHAEAADFEIIAQLVAGLVSGCANSHAFFAENRLFLGVIAHATGEDVPETFRRGVRVLADGERYGVHYTDAYRRHMIAAHTEILQPLCCRSMPVKSRAQYGCTLHRRSRASRARTDRVAGALDLPGGVACPPHPSKRRNGGIFTGKTE